MTAFKTRLTPSQVLDYEVKSSWFASWIGFSWGQELAGKYFAWKVARKFARYKESIERDEWLEFRKSISK